MAVKKGLGKGLDTLIPNMIGTNDPKSDTNSKNENGDQEKVPETMVKITSVEPNREQPR